MKTLTILALVFVATLTASAGAAAEGSPQSKTVAEVLREPLPPEDLRCSEAEGAILVLGPTFQYTVDKATGSIAGLEAVREDEVVARLSGPAELWIDDLRLSEGNGATTSILGQGEELVVVAAQGKLGADVAYALRHTFYNDGVVVTEVALSSKMDLSIQQGIRYEVRAEGRFGQYLHKRRDTNGMDCLKGALPAVGESVELPDLTSCLEVFSPEAALAAFTDRGGTHRWPTDTPTASLQINEKAEGDASVLLTQHLVRIAPGGPAYVLPAGEAFTFRVGLAVAPNRRPHPRWRDLRMFIWVGDGKHPYPTDEEIRTAARLGYTLFQMHRLGTPGEPRPPAEEFDRVLRTVHDAGMLFIWTANADLMYANAPGVVELREAGNWPLWQGFNYGGAYKASMDPYCDLVATCLASPNGLADYRVACDERMLERYAVDGMYIDDNLPYANCTLWKEHGHPEKVYDCLIELHDMNWRRRQTLRSKCPHAVLIDHCSQGIILPAISAFDGHLFAEGYSFPSVEAYWDTFGTLQNLPAQGCLWPGDTESARCAAEVAYAFDLLTGGGQYNYLDWRLWPEKFPYAAGVHPDEALFVKTYNLAQYYFGMYESEPYYFANSKERFATTAPNTYATVYHNQVWNEALVIIANMGKEAATTTSVNFNDPLIPPLSGDGLFAVYDVNRRTAVIVREGEVQEPFADLAIGPQQITLLYVREVPVHSVYHQWGGKRIAEGWDDEARRYSVKLHGPEGLEDTIIFGVGEHGVGEVTINGASAGFFVDSEKRVVHGNVTFAREPIAIAVTCAPNGACKLAERSLAPDALAAKHFASQDAAQ